MNNRNRIRFDWAIKRLLRNKAKELWRVDSLPEDEQRNYSKHLKNLRNEASRMLSLKIDAEDRVRKDEKIEIARKGLKKGYPLEIISDMTGLTIEEIEKLK